MAAETNLLKEAVERWMDPSQIGQNDVDQASIDEGHTPLTSEQSMRTKSETAHGDALFDAVPSTGLPSSMDPNAEEVSLIGLNKSESKEVDVDPNARGDGTAIARLLDRKIEFKDDGQIEILYEVAWKGSSRRTSWELQSGLKLPPQALNEKYIRDCSARRLSGQERLSEDGRLLTYVVWGKPVEDWGEWWPSRKILRCEDLVQEITQESVYGIEEIMQEIQADVCELDVLKGLCLFLATLLIC